MKNKNLYKKKLGVKGFTLVEVLVAMTVLTILVVCFTFTYGWSSENIFLMGEKSRAIANAQEAIERLYVNIDDEVGLKRVDSPDELFAYDENETGNYYVKSNVSYMLEGKEVEGYKVIAVVFYKNGERNVKISSFIMKDTSKS